MQFTHLSIESKDIINTFFHAQRIEASDMLFGNLYIWHFSREIRYCVLHDCLVILTKFPHEPYPFIFYPLGRGDTKAALRGMREYFLDNAMPFSLRSLERTQAQNLESFFPDTFDIVSNRDRFDYLYKVQDLIALGGKKLHNKKNHFNRFLNNYPHFVYEEISAHNASECLETYDEWFVSNPNITYGVRAEYKGIEASLKNLDKLDMKGALIRIDGKIAAFSLGERINDNTAVIHIEKANTFYTGIYQAINQQFLSHAWSDMEFVNREEDLGLEGLRHAKMTYCPISFVEKFNANLKEKT